MKPVFRRSFAKLIGCKKGTSQPEARKFLVGHEMLGSV